MITLCSSLALCAPALAAEEYVHESPRELPLAESVDIVVVGSNAGGLTAAITAAREGLTVIVLNPTFSFSHEISDKGRYWLAEGEVPQTALTKALFGERSSSEGYHTLSPGIFKKTAESLLEEAGVTYYYCAHGAGILEDGSGKVSGVVVANKAGRQAIAAKVVIDATPVAGMARLAGAQATPWQPGEVLVSRTVFRGSGGETVGRYNTFSTTVSMTDGGWVDRCRAEHELRRQFPQPDASWCGAVMHMEEKSAIICKASHDGDSWQGAQAVPLDACRPRDIDYVYVLSGACAVSRSMAPALSRPLALAEIGERIGLAAALEAKNRQTPTGLSVKAHPAPAAATTLDVSELTDDLRPYHSIGAVSQPASALPVLAAYDVVVVGGGSSGAPAGIAAARAGAKTLVIEMLGFLGGTGTNGIGKFWEGYRHGFAMEFGKTSWRSAEKAQWLFDKLDQAGGEVWFNTFACGALQNGGDVRGVVVATPFGRGVVKADVVIDATGDGDVAIAAGADYVYVDKRDLAVQEASYLSEGEKPDGYNNEFNSVLADPIDIWSFTQFITQTRKERTHFDFYPLVGSRESRLIVGDYVITVMDQYLRRTYRDMIAVAYSDFDNHGYFSGTGVYAGIYPEGMSFVPLRSLLPKGLTSILTVGRCKSVTHDALPLVRMQADVANEGYAAGRVAAWSAKENIAIRSIDINQIQDHLQSIGNMTSNQRANFCTDGPAFDEQTLREAAANPGATGNKALLLASPERAVPILREAFAQQQTLAAAKLLCLLEDTAGVAYCAQWLTERSVGSGVPYTFSAFVNYKKGTVLKDEDEVIWALGLARHSAGVSALTKYLNDCPAENAYFSHLRALFIALGRIGDRAAAQAIHSFLTRDGVQGHHKGPLDEGALTREAIAPAFIELFAAAALYRCGDHHGLGETILSRYLDDWRGHLVRYAGAVLHDEESGTVVENARQRRGDARKRCASDRVRLSARSKTMYISYYFPVIDRVTGFTVCDIAGRVLAHRGSAEIADPVKGTYRFPIQAAGAYIVTVTTTAGAISRCIAGR